ncbi:MAG: PAS domain-containing protein [Rhodoferax sp.]|jgi:two-component system CheB/CheR fusion protein|uniref:chemotaxis protein CheB n=1 Tax=Rhodoferax sp. TaxID=50421 RepID=UPI001B478EAC|nr:chemotaxis protein CheB [Rhodoferax sp.]MBP9147652.1 PAS domain-containing protein [Rhodoferax sp.]MBP9737049.1 PAS domain-containing protein [Rhodoferax sp.]
MARKAVVKATSSTAKTAAKAAASATASAAPSVPDAPSPAAVTDNFPIVGIGASAGGLAAFETFFAGMPKGTAPGMAFVLVQHLAPDHKSMLAELIRRYTAMPVFEVEDSMPVAINSIYIIPPNHDMALLGRSLQLLEPGAPRGQRLPIDFFFRSLAQDLHERAIGIVLSGTASDGTLGVRAIKDAGGMVMVQTPESTEFDGMPRSAIATGLVDYQLSPEQMPAQLITYVKYAFGNFSIRSDKPVLINEGALKKIFVLLRTRTGHDFSQYKPSTVHRRIERRMSVHQIALIDDYVRYLQREPEEIEALFRDLLIGVTNFFRDPEAFEALEEQVIPLLFARKSTVGGVVRVWVAGCSTGEEAYSLAILLQERMEALQQSYTVQVFATDLDSRAIAIARAGLYPLGIAADVTPLRLARFFTPEPDAQGYRVHKGIRDMLVFSEQDLTRDPPFSRLDLISCRNLLIYLNADLQKRLMPLFHYALNPQGFLFLGTSEGIGDFLSLFAAIDRKAKLFQRKNAEPSLLRSPSRFLAPSSALEAALPRGQDKDAFPVKLPLRELTEQALLTQVAPAAVLVNATGDILYLHGRTGQFLEPAPGEVGMPNILKMSRDGLRPALSNALHRAAALQQPVRTPGLRVKTNGHYTRVNLSVCPVPTAIPVSDPSPDLPSAPTAQGAHLFLVILEDAPDTVADTTPVAALAEAATASPAIKPDVLAQIAALQDELRAKDEYLQSTHEELESSNEELKSSNEEMQSVNEELQSTNEELETSKEELQSVNEELSTVNSELNVKVDDLSRLNNDMNNLLAGTGIATVFVDHQLRILRFTPTASQLINLIASDVGRPVGHIVSNLVGYSSLVADVQSVLDTLVPKEVQVQTTDAAWFILRIRPYRTLDNVIEGAVITFSDISELKRIEAALAQANRLARLAVVVRDAFDAIVMSDLDGRVLAWNPAAERMYGWTEAQALQLSLRDRVPPALMAEALSRIRQLSEAQVLGPHQTQRLTQSGAVVRVSLVATALLDGSGQMYAISTTERLLTAP